jgi:hypothetical protein
MNAVTLAAHSKGYTMNKQNAIYAAYIIAEALNDETTRKRCLMLYGEHGVTNAKQAAIELAKEWSFEPPMMVTL